MIDWTTFHHNFWENNNHLHSELKSKYESRFRVTTDYSSSFEKETGSNSDFYNEFIELRRKEFDAYHLESWKRNLNLLKVGYQILFEKLNIFKKKNRNIKYYKFENKRLLIKE